MEQSQDAVALNPSQPPALGLSLGFLAGEVDMLITLPLPGCVRTKLKTYTPWGLFPDLPRENGTAKPHPNQQTSGQRDRRWKRRAIAKEVQDQIRKTKV